MNLTKVKIYKDFIENGGELPITLKADGERG